MRISPTPAVSLVAGHAALTSGIHGVTGDIVGTIDAQLINNKISRTDFAIQNPSTGVGAFNSPKITFKGAYDTTLLQMSLHLAAISTTDYRLWMLDKDGTMVLQLGVDGTIFSNGDVKAAKELAFKDETAFYLTFVHAITAARTVTWPDKDITVFGTVDEKVIQVILLDELEISAGAPALAGETGSDTTKTSWTLDGAPDVIRTKNTFSPPKGFNKLKVEILANLDSAPNPLVFQKSLDGAAVAACGTETATALGVHYSDEIAVADTEVIRLLLSWDNSLQSVIIYGFKLIWYQ